MFGSFEKPLFLELCKHIEALHVSSGSLLFSIGEPDDSIYVVQSGKLIVYITEMVNIHFKIMSNLKIVRLE